MIAVLMPVYNDGEAFAFALEEDRPPEVIEHEYVIRSGVRTGWWRLCGKGPGGLRFRYEFFADDIDQPIPRFNPSAVDLLKGTVVASHVNGAIATGRPLGLETDREFGLALLLSTDRGERLIPLSLPGWSVSSL
ncbi:hypothetical protein KG112_10980 [Nocardioides sp. zg-ZUI104]|uniref:hypothetical protein n=1 Tax=Nocardioides faecalis TaxID=2803858 RepID=UPI001BCC1B43|nr:hypothetical protein [Nocardioides faecalis]MBS4753325.1 hypothetical protein [Nocardioides faecalis]